MHIFSVKIMTSQEKDLEHVGSISEGGKGTAGSSSFRRILNAGSKFRRKNKNSPTAVKLKHELSAISEEDDIEEDEIEDSGTNRGSQRRRRFRRHTTDDSFSSQASVRSISVRSGRGR